MAYRIRGYLNELRRRKVYHVAAAYAAAAFVVWEVADIAFPSLGLGQDAVTFVLALTVLGFPVALVLAWAYEVRPEEPGGGGVARRPDEVAGSVQARDHSDVGGAPAPPERASLAILPFEDLSADAGFEYFADGVTEELTHAVAATGHIRVVARTSAFVFKGDRPDVREIGRRLNVAFVVEGSVRRAGERLRITTQLIDAAAGYHVWSDRFERPLGDVFDVQDEIVASVVGRIQGELEPPQAASGDPMDEREAGLYTQLCVDTMRLSTAPVPASPSHWALPSRLAAYDAYLKGRFELQTFDPEAVGRALSLFEEALGHDPGFAPAHAGVAETLTLMSIGFSMRSAGELMPRALAAADRALELEPDLAEGHLARGLALLYYEWSFDEARASLERSVELNPSLARAHMWLEFYWTYVVREFEGSLRILEKAERLSPLDPSVASRKGTVLYISGRLEEAEGVFRSTLGKHPESAIMWLGLSDTLARQGRGSEAVEAALNARDKGGKAVMFLGILAAAHAANHDREDARDVLEEIRSIAETAHVPGFWMAAAHAAAGDLEGAFHHLDRGVAERDGNLLYLPAAPRVLGMRDDPRFAGILERIGLAHLLPALREDGPALP